MDSQDLDRQLGDVRLRLVERYRGALDEAVVTATFDAITERLLAGRVRDYVAVLSERETRQALEARRSTRHQRVVAA